MGLLTQEEFFMKTKILSLLVLLMSVWYGNVAMAQFYSSETVYCYKYVKTVNDGISSKATSECYCFVNFQNDMMGYWYECDVKEIRKKLLESPEYYNEQAINDLAENYNSWKSSPGWTPRGQSGIAVIYKYCDKYSSYNKYTYRRYCKYSRFSHTDVWGNPQGVWGNPSWEDDCYTFSKDRTELIRWSTSDPENRVYYELVDIESLKPNTDFLD